LGGSCEPRYLRRNLRRWRRFRHSTFIIGIPPQGNNGQNREKHRVENQNLCKKNKCSFIEDKKRGIVRGMVKKT
jgi:hypothetical protein